MYRLPALATVLALAACGWLPTERVDPDLCPQTYEFGNHGCARVEGRVLEPSGAPVVGAYVRLAPPEDGSAGGYDTPVPRTDTEGRFRIEIHRMSEQPRPVTPDTLTVYLRASWAATRQAVRDSVPVLLHFAPVGAEAITTRADIVLDTPWPLH